MFMGWKTQHSKDVSYPKIMYVCVFPIKITAKIL